MNFKTTLVLIVLLAVAAVALFVTRDKGGETDTTSDVAGDGRKLIDITADQVTKVTVAPSVGDKFTLVKTGADWRLTEPVAASADSFEVDSLVRAITDARSRGALDSDDAVSDATGLSTPSYRIDLIADGRPHTINVGATSAIGGNVYVSVGEDGKDVHVTDAALVDQLEKPLGEYRRTQLVDVSSNDVRQITVTDAGGKVTIRAQKQGEDWQIVEPTKMPAEKSAIDDMIFAATGLRAVEFVSENAADAPKYQLDKPRLTVALSTEPPATQPTTAPATTQNTAGTTIGFGRHDDVRKQNVYATVSGSPSIAKVPATVLESFGKQPLDLRDKRAVNIDPEQVSRLSFTSDQVATTQPTSRPASNREVAIQRRTSPSDPASAGGSAPALSATPPTTNPSPSTSQLATTQPETTQPATTQVATQPAVNLSTWELISDPKGEATDEKVAAILTALHPLRAQTYLQAVPTTQAAPLATHTINLTTEAPGGANVQQHQIRLTDRADDQPLIGEYNGLIFELDPAILRLLEGEFTKGSAPAAPSTPTLPAGANEPTLPFPLGQ